MDHKRRLILLLAISLSVPILGSAETVVLKSGKTIEGKITERTDKYIKMNFQGEKGAEITYFLKDIERIEGEQSIMPTSNSPQSSRESQEGFYVDDQFGFKIKAPAGWFLRQDVGEKLGIVLFAKQAAGQTAPPMLLVRKNMVPQGIQGSLEFAKILLTKSQDFAKTKDIMLQVVEEPHDIEANGKKGARFVFDMAGQDGKMVRNIDCEFMQGTSAISAQGMDYPDNFQSSLKVFEEAINSLQFLSEGMAEPGGLYINDELGFEIKAPNGWFLRKDPRGRGMFFTRQATGQTAMPYLGINIDRAPANAQTSLDAAKFFSQQYQSSASKNNATFNFIEPVHEVDVGGSKGARFIFTMLNKDGRGMKSLDCKFMRDNMVVSLQGMDFPNSFQNNLKDFEEAIGSFKFLVPEDNFTQLQKLNNEQLNFKPIETALWEALKKQIIEKMGQEHSFQSSFTLKDKTNVKLADKDYKSIEWSMQYVSPQSFEISQSNYYRGEADTWRVVGDKIYFKIGFWQEMPTQFDAADKSQAGILGIVKNQKEIYKRLSFVKYLDLMSKGTPSGIMENSQDKYTIIQFKPQQINDLFTDKPKEGSFTQQVLVWVDNKDKAIRFAKTIIEGKDKGGKEVKEEYEHYFDNYNFPFMLGIPKIEWKEKSK